jgi:hypothetical protein
MEIVRIEPTPSPNTMKITVNETKEEMKSSTYKEITEDTPHLLHVCWNLKMSQASSMHWTLSL